MLNAEQPDSDYGSQGNDRHLNQQHRPDTQSENKDERANRQTYIGQVYGQPLLGPGERRLERDPIQDQENDRRHDDMGDQRMAHRACHPFPPGGHCLILLERQACRIDVTGHIARVEVIPLLVVQRMMAPPIGKRRECRQATQDPNHQIGSARDEECAMATIMLNDEEPHHEPSRR